MPVKSLDKVYGPGASWDSPDVQEDVKNKAMAVLRSALAGLEIKPEQMKAMELVMSKSVWRDGGTPRASVTVFGKDKLEAALKKAGITEVRQKVLAEGKPIVPLTPPETKALEPVPSLSRAPREASPGLAPSNAHDADPLED